MPSTLTLASGMVSKIVSNHCFRILLLGTGIIYSFSLKFIQVRKFGVGMKKMFGRLMSGDSAFQNRYTAEGADGMIAFASSFPGAIKALEISNGHSMIVQKSAFLASEEGVELSMHFQKKLGKGIFGGEGFIMQRLSGNGTAFVEIDGHAVEYDLSAGQEMLISTGYLAAMEETCTMDIVTVKGVKNMLIGGEGIFNTVVKGPGKVIL